MCLLPWLTSCHQLCCQQIWSFTRESAFYHTHRGKRTSEPHPQYLNFRNCTPKIRMENSESRDGRKGKAQLALISLKDRRTLTKGVK